jgi:proteic killer suppression protein
VGTHNPTMRIRSIRHKGLARLVEHDDPSGLHPHVIDKVIKIVAFLRDMSSEQELYMVPVWKAHGLTGDRKGSWSLFVSRNWPITFKIDRDEVEIVDLDFEDYHWDAQA